MFDDVSLSVYITHFIDSNQTSERSRQRQKLLATELMYLAAIDVGSLSVNVFSNVQIENFNELSKPILARTSQSTIKNYVASKDELTENGKILNWLLTWVHKSKMKKDVERGRNGLNNYYLYLEDDALFTETNLLYFIAHLPELKKVGLVPGFLRSEWSSIHGCWTHPDSFSRINFHTDFTNYPTNPDLLLAQHENPFSACILLDQSLAEEYFESESSIQQLACYKHPIIFDIGSTAALGLISENVPRGYKHRTAVICNSRNLYPLPGSLIRHQDDRYGNDVWQRHYRVFDDIDSSNLETSRTIIDYAKRLRKPDRFFVIVRSIDKLIKKVFQPS